jgi:hypothetical protein
MFKALSISLLTITIAVGSSQRARAQDSVQVVILSEKVGQEIDAREREYYHLFSQIEGFHSARIIRTPDGTFEVRFLCAGADGKISSRILQYEGATLLNMAEKIDHFEELKSGDYIMGSRPAKLRVITAQSSVPEEITVKFAEPAQAVVRAMALLPNVTSDPPVDLQKYPRFRCGAGIYGYTPNADAVSTLLGSVEQAARSQGYPVGSRKIFLDISSLYAFTLGVDITRDISVELEAGRTGGDGDFSLKTVSFSVVYCVNSLNFVFLRPFLGVGISKYDFAAGHEYLYGATKPADSTGGYWEFTSVWFKGKYQATAPTFVVGLETPPTKGWMGLALRLGAKYVNCPAISVSTGDTYSSELDMKRLSFGANIFVYF